MLGRSNIRILEYDICLCTKSLKEQTDRGLNLNECSVPYSLYTVRTAQNSLESCNYIIRDRIHRLYTERDEKSTVFSLRDTEERALHAQYSGSTLVDKR